MLEHRMGLSPARVVPAGDRPDDSLVASVRKLGVRWSSWACADSAEVHHVINAAVWDADRSALRFDARAPSAITADIEIDGEPGSALVVDLSPGGMCVVGTQTPAVGAPMRISFTLEEREIELKARLAWSRCDEHDRSKLGLSFRGVDGRTDELLRSFVARWLSRHRLVEAR